MYVCENICIYQKTRKLCVCENIHIYQNIRLDPLSRSRCVLVPDVHKCVPIHTWTPYIYQHSPVIGRPPIVQTL